MNVKERKSAHDGIVTEAQVIECVETQRKQTKTVGLYD